MDPSFADSEQTLQQMREHEYGFLDLVQNAKLQLEMSMRSLRAEKKRKEAESNARIMRERSMEQESWKQKEVERVEGIHLASQRMASEPTDREMAEVARLGSEQAARDEGMSEQLAKEHEDREQADSERMTREQAERERSECEQLVSQKNWQKNACDVGDAAHMEWAQERHVRDQSQYMENMVRSFNTTPSEALHSKTSVLSERRFY